MTGSLYKIALAFGLALLVPALAQAQQLAAGQHVVIGSTGETGTILKIGQSTPEGGVMVKVRLDKPTGPTEADREIWYNSRSSRVTVVSQQAAPAAPAAPAPAAAPASAPAGAKGELKVGDHVRIGSLGVNGTISQIGGKLGNGALMVLVEIDKNAPKFPGMAKWYDTLSSQITAIGN